MASNSIIGASGDYSTLQAWVEAKNADTGAVNASCQGTGDLGEMNLGTWAATTTDIAAAGGNEQTADVNDAGPIATAGNMVISPSGVVTISVRNMRINGYLYFFAAAAQTFGAIRNLIVVGEGETFDGWITMGMDGGGGPLSVSAVVRNNIVYIPGTSASPGAGIGIVIQTTSPADSMDVDLYNNTVVQDSSPGHELTAGISLLAAEDSVCTVRERNNIVLGVDVDDCFITNGFAVVTASNNLSTDNTAPGASSFHGQSTASTVTSPTSPHLTLTSAALNTGATIANFSDDSIGVLRPQGPAWDIGALELIVSAMNHARRRILRFWRH